MSTVLFISGPPGIGKTSVAEALSEQLKIPFFDLDQLIEKEKDTVLSAYIQNLGWSEFRQSESNRLQELCQLLTRLQSNATQKQTLVSGFADNHDQTYYKLEAVVSLGGGCVLKESNRLLMRELGPIFSLWGSQALIKQRLHRRVKHNPQAHPLPLSSSGDLNQLLLERLPVYLDCDAWIEVYEGESPKQVAQRIQKIWTHHQTVKNDLPEMPDPSSKSFWYSPPHQDSFFSQNLKPNSSEQTDVKSAIPPLEKSETPPLMLHDYPIYLESSAQDKLIDQIIKWLTSSVSHNQKAPQLAVFSDDIVARLYGGELVGALQSFGIQAHLISFPVGEQSKQLRVVEALSTQLLKLNFTRSDCLLALGGGVSGDLCGFVASIYLRGVSWAQIPSTLLAQVDSSIGAKTAVNHPLGKNLLGAFYRPDWVWIDDHYLKTLPLRHLKAGWVEALKHALISDPKYFEVLSTLSLEDCFNEPNSITPVIERGLQIKAHIVAQDELEKGSRALLNLGHTLGHAFEKADPNLLHGEAVALGISFTAEYSHYYNGLGQEQVQQIKLSLAHHDLAIDWRKYINEKLFKRLAFDKKRSGSQLNFVTLDAIGKANIEPIDFELFKARVNELSQASVVLDIQ